MTDTFTSLPGRGREQDGASFRRAFAVLYDELRGVAHQHRRRWEGDETLSTTVLVHEAYLKMANGSPSSIEGRGHFLGIASRAMRHVLCNHARGRRRLKRGGAMRRTLTPLDEIPGVGPEDLETIIALDAALDRLRELDERLARVVECRFFAGLSVPDTADVLDTSPATVKRDWAMARAWLHEELGAGGA